MAQPARQRRGRQRPRAGGPRLRRPVDARVGVQLRVGTRKLRRHLGHRVARRPHVRVPPVLEALNPPVGIRHLQRGLVEVPAVAEARGAVRRREQHDLRVGAVGHPRGEAQGVGEGGQLPGRVVPEGRRPAEGIRDPRQAQGIGRILVRQGRHLAQGVGEGDEPVLRVVGQGDGVALRIPDLGEEDAPGARRRGVGQREDLDAAAGEPALIPNGIAGDAHQLRVGPPGPGIHPVRVGRVVALQAAPPHVQVHRGREAVVRAAVAPLAVRGRLLGVGQPLVRPLRPEPPVDRHLRVQGLAGVVAQREEHGRPAGRRVPDGGVGQEQARAVVDEAVDGHAGTRSGAGAAAPAAAVAAAPAGTLLRTALARPGVGRAAARAVLLGIGRTGRAQRTALHRGRLGSSRQPPAVVRAGRRHQCVS